MIDLWEQSLSCLSSILFLSDKTCTLTVSIPLISTTSTSQWEVFSRHHISTDALMEACSMERLLSYMLTFRYWILTRIDVHPQFIRQVLSQGSHQNSNLLFLLPVLILTIFLILKLNRNSDMSYLFWLRFVLLCFKRMKHIDFYPSWYTTPQSPMVW